VHLAARDTTDAAIAKPGTSFGRVDELGDKFPRGGYGRARGSIHGSPVWSLACGYLTTAPEILPATPAQAAGVLRWTPNVHLLRGVPLELVRAMSSADNPLAVEHLPVALVFERRRRHDSILCLRSLGRPLDRKRPTAQAAFGSAKRLSGGSAPSGVNRGSKRNRVPQ
jgi:hypothetical protein